MIPILKRLARMGPHEIGFRTRQAILQRIDARQNPAKPRLPRASASPLRTPRFFDPPTNCPPGLLAEAEIICRRRFNLLGYEGLDFGREIDWHLDPVHHKRAPREPWYRIPFLDFDRVGDHKIVWELNRHQHLVILAQAWWFTKEDRFITELLAQFESWQRENPYPIGINWASTLEVAFRALSWLWVRFLLADCPAVPASFQHELLAALHQHGWYIERYLSTYFAPNTHLLGEGVALFAIGLLCPQFPRARRWQDRGWHIVLHESQAQILPDGFHFEQSVYYHGYALDFFRYARALAACNAIAIPPEFDAVIERMSASLAAVSQAGLPPNFGDDDGGRVLMPVLPHSQPAIAGSVAFKSFGLYAMTANRAQLFIDAGPHGVFAGGHGHADALSIQLVRAGRRALIDSGTFCYVCPDRNRFRGTAAHNTLQVDGRDQARPLGPFAWAGMPRTAVEKWVTTETFDFFAGRHDGYSPVIHHRSVFGLKNRFWLVRDVAFGSGRHRLDLHWHFLDEHDIAILPPAGHDWAKTVERFAWSPVYGKMEPAFVLTFCKDVLLPGEFAVILTEPNAAGTFTSAAPGAYCYDLAGESHEFQFHEERVTWRAKTAAGIEEISI